MLLSFCCFAILVGDVFTGSFVFLLDPEDVPLESISCSISALQNMDSKGSSSGSSKNRNEPVKPSPTKIAKQQRKATIQKKEEIKIKQEAHQQCYDHVLHQFNITPMSFVILMLVVHAS
ncbi:hypothetical protein Tco_1453990 [Tanacetum coccineum]